MAARITPFLLGLILASGALSPDCRGQGEARASFRSTPLGIALELPAGWNARGALTCGSGLFGRIARELRQTPLLVQSFHHEKFDLWLRLNVIQEIVPERIAEHERWLSGSSIDRIWEPFQFADARIGRRLRCAGAASVDPPAEANTSFTYVLIAGTRRFELSGYCRSSQVHEFLPVFDAVARSIELVEPVVERLTPGTWKTGRRLGVRFEYPGDWTWDRPWEDAAAVRSESIYLRAPGDDDRKHDARVSVTINRGPAGKNLAPAAIEQKLREACDKMNASGRSTTTLSSYRNAIGRVGWRMDSCTGSDEKSRHSRMVMLPVTDIEWITVTCNEGGDDVRRWSDVIDRIVGSVEIE